MRHIRSTGNTGAERTENGLAWIALPVLIGITLKGALDWHNLVVSITCVFLCAGLTIVTTLLVRDAIRRRRSGH